MRTRVEGISMAERLNNTLAELHALKLEHQREKERFSHQLEHAREEIERLKGKNKDLRRQIREVGRQEVREQLQQKGQSEQIVIKIQGYLQRLQQSSKQMVQVAAECKIVDADIERAATQIERNIIKTANGLGKYVQELIRKWGANETLKQENRRLQQENRHLFQLTSNLQQKLKQAERLPKQRGRLESNEGIKARVSELTQENQRLKNLLGSKQVTSRQNATKSNTMSPSHNDFEEKMANLSDKIRRLEQENTTIKNIHQRTMKKLQKLQEKNSQKEDKRPDGEGLQQQRKKWLQKTEDMYEEIRRLNKQLILSEQSEKKVRQELKSCLQIYGRWQQQKQMRKHQIQQLKIGIETYLGKIQQLQSTIVEKDNEIESLMQRYQVSEGQKQKIVSVYQLQVQQLNDQLFKRQDTIAQLETIMNKEHYKHEQLKKQYTQLTKSIGANDQKSKTLQLQVQSLKVELLEQEKSMRNLERELKQKDDEILHLYKKSDTDKVNHLAEINRIVEQKNEIVQIMEEIKDEYSSTKKEFQNSHQEILTLKQQKLAYEHELKSILGVNGNQIEIWSLIGNLRDRFKMISDEAKSLREAQIRLISQMQERDQEHDEIIDEMEIKYLKIKQQFESQSSNQETELKINKMKILQKQICSQSQISACKSMTDLLILLINKKESNQLGKKGTNESIEEKVALKQQIIQKQMSLKAANKQLQTTSTKLCELEQIQVLQQKLRKEAQLERDQARGQLVKIDLERKQLDSKLIETERKLSQAKTRQMQLYQKLEHFDKETADLKKQLEIKCDQIEDFEEQKVMIQQKLDFARTVFQRNKGQQHIIEQLNAQLQSLKKRESNISQKKDVIDDQSESKLQELKKIYKQLQKQNSDYLKQISEMLKQNEQIISQNGQLHLQFEQFQEQISLLNQKIQFMKSKEVELSETIKTKQGKIGEYLQIIELQQIEKKGLQKLGQQLAKKLDSQQQNEKLQISNIQPIEEGLDNDYEIIKLTLEIEQKDRRLQQLEGKLSELLIQLNSKLVVIQQLQQQNQKIHFQNAQIQYQNSILRLDLQTFKQNNKKVCMDVKKDIEVVNQLPKQQQSQIEELSVQQDPSEKKKDIQFGKLDSSISENYQLFMPEQEPQTQNCTQIHQNVNQINTFKDNQYENKLNNLVEQLQKANQQINADQQSILDMETTNIKLKVENQDLNNKILVLTDEKKQLIEEITLLKKEINNLEQQMSNFEIKINNKSAETGFLEQQLLGLKKEAYEKKENLQLILRQKQSQIAQLSMKQNKIQKDYDVQMRKNKYLQQKLLKLTSLQVELNEVRQKLMEEKTLSNQLKIKTLKLTEQISALRQEINLVTKQKESYINRLNEIQELMEELKQEQINFYQLREAFDALTFQKGDLERKVSEMQKEKEKLMIDYASNVNNLQSKNKKIIGEFQNSKKSGETNETKLLLISSQNMKLKQEVKAKSQRLEQFESIGYSIQQIKQNIKILGMLQQQNQQFKQKIKQYQTLNAQLKFKVYSVQKNLSSIEQLLSQKQEMINQLQNQNKKMSTIIKNNSQKIEQNSQINRKLSALKGDIQELKEQIIEKDKRITDLRKQFESETRKKQQLQQNFNEKLRQYDNLKNQTEHYKSEIKRLNKEKVLAENQKTKCKFDLQQMQRASRLRQSKLESEVKNSVIDNEQLIKQLKRQVEFLKQSNSQLKEQSCVGFERRSSRSSSRSFQIANQDPYQSMKDLPLQVGNRLRQKSIKMLLEESPKNGQQQLEVRQRLKFQEENKQLKCELSKYQKTEGKLKQLQNNSNVLNNELQYLRRQLNSKSSNIQTLQKQYKSKIEDYSKLQRAVESLNDELSLERKRVKNFQDLYQNIQSKRLKLSRQSD